MPSYVLHGTGIFTDMNGLDFMANVGKYSIGGAYYGTVCVSIERFFKISLSLSLSRAVFCDSKVVSFLSCGILTQERSV